MLAKRVNMAATLAQLEMQTRCGDPAYKCITVEMLETDEATAWQLSRAATRGPGSKAMEAALTGTHRGACHRGVVAMLQHTAAEVAKIRGGRPITMDMVEQQLGACSQGCLTRCHRTIPSPSITTCRLLRCPLT